MQILFCDWNGTLFNDGALTDAARDAVFRAFGKKPPTRERYFRALERTGDYREAYRLCGLDATYDELNAIWIPVYEKRMHEMELFPKAKETLAKLHERGTCLALVTAHMHKLTYPILKKFGIHGWFRYRMFNTTNKRMIVGAILHVHDADPRQCYFVGDAPSDIQHAKMAGVNAIAFLAGHIPEKLVRKANADHYIRSFEELLALP